jgi:dienelactone hydrolase
VSQVKPAVGVLLSLAVLGVASAGLAQRAVEPAAETVWIPMTEKPPLGAPAELRLEGMLYRPPSPGRVPVLVFNHGSTGGGRVAPTSTDWYRYPEVARFFVERGWAVLIPMRRGRGASGGEYLERYECDRATLERGVDRAVADLDAVLAFVSSQPWADMDRLLLGGMSRGGLLSVLYPSQRRTNAKAVINFAGGWTIERCDRASRFNTDTFAEAGRSGKLPMLWLYSENDRNYGPGAVQSYHRAFIQAGGTAELQLFPPIGHDGHILLPGAITVWQTAVQDFLVRIGLDRPRD